MSTEIKGSLVLNQISTDGGTTWLTILCETDSKISSSSAVTEVKTKTCGTKVTTSNDAIKVSGSGLAMGDLGATEISYQQMEVLRDANTLIKFKRQNSLLGTLTAGEVTYHAFDGYITTLTETSNAEGAVTFDWEITSSGVVDLTP